MKRAVVWAAESVYNFSTPFVDACWLSWPWSVISLASAKVADWLDPIPPRA